jgi:transcriptional regulator with XRE-family HTH domain
LELSARTIQRIENGEVDPRAYTLQMIANALDVDYDLFIESDSDEEKELKEDKNNNWLALMHLSGLFLLFIPSIIIWNWKKDEVKELSKHFKDIIWFQLSFWLLFILPGFFLLGGIKAIIAAGIIFGGAMTIINTIKVLDGKPYKYILTIHFKDKNGKSKLTFK